MTVIVGRSKFSDYFKVSMLTVDRWLKRGMPYHTKPGEAGETKWSFDLSVCKPWVAEFRTTHYGGQSGPSATEQNAYQLAKTQEMQAKAERAKIELAQMKKELLLAKDVETYLTQAFTDFRTRMLAIPDRLSATLASLDEFQIHQALRETITEVLNDCATYRPE